MSNSSQTRTQQALLIVLLILALLIINREVYGRWNPLGLPKRLSCFGRLYRASTKTVMLTGNDMPHHLVYTPHLLTGKRIYLHEPRGEYVPTVLYLYLGKHTYLPFALVGGP